MCSVEEYLNNIISIIDIQDQTVNHLPALNRISGNVHCDVSFEVLLESWHKFTPSHGILKNIYMTPMVKYLQN